VTAVTAATPIFRVVIPDQPVTHRISRDGHPAASLRKPSPARFLASGNLILVTRMVEAGEKRVTMLAHRTGLALTRASCKASAPLYQLVEPETKTPVFPGGSVDGVSLRELEDWLRFPWE
jgi:hypothetical protein